MQSFRSVVTKAGIKLVVGISEDKRLLKHFNFDDFCYSDGKYTQNNEPNALNIFFCINVS